MLGVSVLSLSVGAARLPLFENLQVLIGSGVDTSRTIILNVRMPRIATALCVGTAFAMVGCVMQNVLRNPLASASTLGISQGASFGAAVAIVYFEAGIILATGTISPYTVIIFAFLGRISTAVLILLLSFQSGMSPSTMIL